MYEYVHFLIFERVSLELVRNTRRRLPCVCQEWYESRISFEKPDTYVLVRDLCHHIKPRVISQFWPLARRSSRRKAFTGLFHASESAAFREAEVLR